MSFGCCELRTANYELFFGLQWNAERDALAGLASQEKDLKNANAINNLGNTPLKTAVLKDNRDIVELLRKHHGH